MRFALVASPFVLMVGGAIAQQTWNIPAQFPTIQQGIAAASGVPATATIQSSTATADTAPIGAAIFAALPTTVVASILWGNNGIDVFEQFGYTMAVSGSDIAADQHLGVSTNFFADPLFVDPATGDDHLSALSPCVDNL